MNPMAMRSAGGDEKCPSMKRLKSPKMVWIVVPTIIRRMAVSWGGKLATGKENIRNCMSNPICGEIFSVTL